MVLEGSIYISFTFYIKSQWMFLFIFSFYSKPRFQVHFLFLTTLDVSTSCDLRRLDLHSISLSLSTLKPHWMFLGHFHFLLWNNRSFHTFILGFIGCFYFLWLEKARSISNAGVSIIVVTSAPKRLFLAFNPGDLMSPPPLSLTFCVVTVTITILLNPFYMTSK